MTKPPDRTIRELVNDLYRRLDIASRPRCAEARILEQIGLAADALQTQSDPRVAALEARCRELERFAVAQREFIAVAMPYIGCPIDWPEEKARIDQKNLDMKLVAPQDGVLPDGEGPHRTDRRDTGRDPCDT